MLAFTGSDTFKEPRCGGCWNQTSGWMEDHNVSMAGVMHLNKDLIKDLLSRVTASGAFTAIVRIAPSLGFRIIECSVTGEDEDVPTSRVAILGDSE
jgi:hypothetical protein